MCVAARPSTRHHPHRMSVPPGRIVWGRCIPNNQCCTDGDCPAATPRCCSGACVDVLTDVKHCGRCGAGCKFNEQCSVGSCRCGTDSSAAPGVAVARRPVAAVMRKRCTSTPYLYPSRRAPQESRRASGPRGAVGRKLCPLAPAAPGNDLRPWRLCYSSTPCVEDLTAYCQRPENRLCGVWPGPCGRPVDCGSCPPGPTAICAQWGVPRLSQRTPTRDAAPHLRPYCE